MIHRFIICFNLKSVVPHSAILNLLVQVFLGTEVTQQCMQTRITFSSLPLSLFCLSLLVVTSNLLFTLLPCNQCKNLVKIRLEMQIVFDIYCNSCCEKEIKTNTSHWDLHNAVMRTQHRCLPWIPDLPPFPLLYPEEIGAGYWENVNASHWFLTSCGHKSLLLSPLVALTIGSFFLQQQELFHPPHHTQWHWEQQALLSSFCSALQPALASFPPCSVDWLSPLFRCAKRSEAPTAVMWLCREKVQRGKDVYRVQAEERQRETSWCTSPPARPTEWLQQGPPFWIDHSQPLSSASPRRGTEISVLPPDPWGRTLMSFLSAIQPVLQAFHSQRLHSWILHALLPSICPYLVS